MKKQIEKRLRGWLLKETTLPKTSTQTNFPPTQMHHLNKPTQIQFGPGTLRATKFLMGLTILWTFSSFLFITQIYRNYQLPFYSVIVSITVGLILGLTMSAAFTQNQIRYFERNSRFPPPNPSALLVTLVVVIIAFMIVSFGLAFSFPTIWGEVLISVFSITPAFYAARCLLLLHYEKKKEVYIIQYWLQPGTFVLPKKAPDEDTQAVQEMVAKQENGGLS
jgi:hypothetical protein